MLQIVRRRLLPFLALIAFSTSGGAAFGGSYDQGFADLLARTPRGSFVSGLVMMREQLDLQAIDRRVAEEGLTSRWRRHQVVVVDARELASRTQADLVRTLDGMRKDARVRSYQTFWITNMVAVEALPDVFDAIQARYDVGTIFENAEVNIREGWQEPPPLQKSVTTLPDNLVCVNVEPAWSAGFHGEGRLVADFDTGADGNHPAFAARWRGAQPGVPWWEAWRDPYNDTTFPWDHQIHGTHTLGIMVGQKPDGTPIGVAPGAQWIAAGILIGWNVQKVIDCYQWATDPDGDPGTVSDVPDVINNSWGTSGNCSDTFWNAIEVTEAAGIVNTIAVDNTGPGPMSVNSPESRAASPTVNWGVGNVNPHVAGYPIASSSGRGPSPCDSVSIKPEVTAPGTQIYSTLPGNSYGTLTGTSMACPHTSGAIAILRQVDPDLTVEEAKTALMATAVDKGLPGEDNDYGWGIIDIGAAVAYVEAALPMLPPRDLTAQIDGQEVTLTWSRPQTVYSANPLQEYRVYRAPAGELFPLTPVAQLPPLQIPSYGDPNVPFGTYHYVVTAVYQQGESGPSNDITADLIAPPSPPRDLTMSVVADTVSLAWQPPDSVFPNNKVLSYRVYRAPVEEPYPSTPIGELPDSVLAYMETGVPVGSFRYAVTALFSNGESPFSNEVQVRMVDPAGALDLSKPAGLALRISPNPFEGTTALRYRSASQAPLNISIYDPSGARVRMLVTTTLPAGGEETVSWDGRDESGRPAASGAYFVRLEQAGKTVNCRITLLR
jgi:subtilisin family serine protease